MKCFKKVYYINTAFSLSQIQLFWSKANAEPSEKVSLRISVTQPDSTVGIVAVDKSVNLMNVSNDITMENVSLAIFLLQKYTLKEKKRGTLLCYFQVLKEISFFKYKSVIVKLLNEEICIPIVMLGRVCCGQLSLPSLTRKLSPRVSPHFQTIF